MPACLPDCLYPQVHPLGLPETLYCMPDRRTALYRMYRLPVPQVHLDDHGSVEEAYLAGKRRLAGTTSKISNQNAPALLGGKVGGRACGLQAGVYGLGHGR